ncbi:MAG TPA: hypothetical protein DCY13_11725 [Verrucomicrobiales bacterium]|nr:hypothetical protein [Verrucomicrobiales bacterium]
MKTLNLAVLLLFACLSLLVLLACLGLYSQRQNSLSMEAAVAAANARSDTLEHEIARLTAEQARLERVSLERAAAEKATVPVEKPQENTSTNRPAYPQSFQARTFAGDRYIGMAWVLPSNMTEDKETGQMRFEPVILLTEGARAALTQTTTNYVDREIVRNNTLNQNWVYQQPYWYGYPIWVFPENPQLTNPPASRPPPRLPSPNRDSFQQRLLPSTGIEPAQQRLLPTNDELPAGARGRIVPPAAAGTR